MTGRVVTAVNELAGALSDATTPRQLTGLLRETYLPRLQLELTAAGEGGFTRLEPWISGLLQELDQAIATATDELAGSAAGGSRLPDHRCGLHSSNQRCHLL